MTRQSPGPVPPSLRGATPLREHGRDPTQIADLIENNADELVRLESQNNRVPIAVTHAEEIPHGGTRSGSSPVPRACSKGERPPVHMSGFTSPSAVSPSVIGQVTPWNYPPLMAI